MKKVLVINANPQSHSFCRLMAEQYAATAGTRREVALVHLSELQFQADLHQGYDEKQQLEPDLIAFQQQLLKGRTSELLLTLDTPELWYTWWPGNPLYFQVTRTILGFVGIQNMASHYFGPVISADEKQRQRWLAKVQQLAGRSF